MFVFIALIQLIHVVWFNIKGNGLFLEMSILLVKIDKVFFSLFQEREKHYYICI